MTPAAGTSESSTHVGHVRRLEPTTDAAAVSRAFVEPLVRQWNLGPLDFEAALVTTELVTNAVLHAELDVVLVVRLIANGVRIEVSDQCPAVLPHVAPYRTGALWELTLGQSGRGLRVVSELAARWGVATTQRTKTVWAELIDGQSGPSDPVLELEYELVVEDGVTLQYHGLPTKVAIESGVQIEDVVRAIQLEHGPEPPAEGNVARFYQLLLSTAADRLAARDAMTWAFADEREVFDLELLTTLEALADLGALWLMIDDPNPLLDIVPPPPTPRMVEFRDWMRNETLRQIGGDAPRSYGAP